MQKSFGILFLLIGIVMIVFGTIQYKKDHNLKKVNRYSGSHNNDLSQFTGGHIDEPESDTLSFVLIGGGVLFSIIGGIMIWNYKKGQNLHS